MADIRKVKEWFEDKLNLRNRVEVEIGKYFACYYEKDFSGKLVGNVSICKDNKEILHTTTNTPITKKELAEMLKNYLNGEKDNDK